MHKNDLVIRSAIIATKEKLPDKFLSVGRIQKNASSLFLFYILEVISDKTAGQKIQKIITDTLEKAREIDEKNFEITLKEINEELNELANKDYEWVGRLNAVVGFSSNDQICLSQTGKISGYIFRKGKISSLTDTNSLAPAPHPLNTFSDITVGKCIPEDKVVIGNTELYNHLSLDRLRRIVENCNAAETIFELFKTLKKNKIKTTNIIAFDVTETTKLSNETLNELPELIYLDLPDENIFQKLNKRYGPEFDRTKKTIKKHSKILAKKIKTKYDESKKSWEEYYGPKTKELARKTGPAVTQVYDRTRKKIAPEIEKMKKPENYEKIKIKTRIYTEKTQKGSKIILKFLIDCSRFIKNILSKKEYRKYLILALILVLFFIGFLKIKANNDNQEAIKQRQENAIAYDKAKDAYAKAKENLALGKTAGIDDLTNSLSLALKAEKDPASNEKASKLAKQIQAAIDKITLTTRIYSTDKNISINNKNLKIAVSGNNIYVIASDGKIYTTASDADQVKLIASVGKNNGTIVDTAYSASENTIFVYTSEKKVIGFNIDKNVQSVLESNNGWEDAAALGTFSTNIYLLDKTSGKVWKHSLLNNSYTSGSSSISGNNLRLEDSIDLEIDGNIYILFKDGSVNKFSKGSKDNDFSLQKLPEPDSKIVDPKKIYTGEDTNYIYILDKAKNRVVKFDKSGEFVKQYTLDGSDIDDFAINEKLQKIWFTSESKIYETDL